MQGPVYTIGTFMSCILPRHVGPLLTYPIRAHGKDLARTAVFPDLYVYMTGVSYRWGLGHARTSVYYRDFCVASSRGSSLNVPHTCTRQGPPVFLFPDLYFYITFS